MGGVTDRLAGTAAAIRARATRAADSDAAPSRSWSDTLAAAFRSCLRGNSFSADTRVVTGDGPVPIAEVEEGDLVLAYNEATGETGYYTVTAVMVHADPVVVELTIDGELIATTPEHPFYALERGWVEAGELRAGDEVRRADGTTGTVGFLEVVAQPAGDVQSNCGPGPYLLCGGWALVGA
ncbi:MAG: hypothetical protein KatS3mg057_2344 [Herpetosiphonaceae bacterium]|nr:MAG: hypothetical protein KatS3mg057_2344 [Herpetosiphonaceae bacterium]